MSEIAYRTRNAAPWYVPHVTRKAVVVRMYIIAIGWMYVVTLMAATEENIAAGVATFLFYGALPCAVLMYILGTKRRRAKRAAMEAAELQLQNAQKADPGGPPADEKTTEG